MKRLGDEDAEAFAGIVSEPAAFEAVLEAEIQTVLGALGDDGDIGAEGVEMLALVGKGHFAIPNDDAHGGSAGQRGVCFDRMKFCWMNWKSGWQTAVDCVRESVVRM